MEILNQLHQSTIASIVFANHCILGLTKVGSDPGTESRGPSRRRVIGFPPIRLRPWRPPPCFPCMSFYSQVFTFGVVEFCDLSSCFVCTPTSANFSSSRIEDFFIFFFVVVASPRAYHVLVSNARENLRLACAWDLPCSPLCTM